jgi:hypothetical protein
MDEQDIAEAILVAARAITDATRTLVHAATSVQRELQAAGKVNPHLNVYKKDPAWAMGLISAAQSVSSSVELLVESANETAKDSNEETEAKLIAAVHMVGGATARLVAAARVKADPNSPSQARLENAARAVANATKKLSEAARSRESNATAAAGQKSEAQLSAVALQRQKLEQEAKIILLREQLAAAEKGVYDMRKNEYAPNSRGSPAASSSNSHAPEPSSSGPSPRGIAPPPRGGMPPRGARGRGVAGIPPPLAK